MERRPYDINVTDAQWLLISSSVLQDVLCSGPGRPRRICEILDAVLYLVRTGCQWRSVPHDFPKWENVYYHFRQWRLRGIWGIIHDILRTELRVGS